MINKAIVLLQQGDIFLFSVVLALATIVNIGKVISFMDFQKKKRIELLKEAIDFSGIDERLKNHFSDEIKGEYFRLIHKVRMDNKIRELALQKYDELCGSISFIHFKRASPHLIAIDGRLDIEITKFDNVNYWFNMVAGVVMTILGYLLFAISNFAKGIVMNQLLSWLVMSCFFIAFGVFMLSQTFPVFSAKKIRKVMK